MRLARVDHDMITTTC